MSEVTSDEMPGHPVAVLTGPNLAKEILGGQPAASVVAIDDEVIAAELQRIFSRPSLRIYTNPDVVGCEVGGVVKNVIAIASGMAEGMGFGDNTRATLITRGLAEMTRLGMAMGGAGDDVRRAGRHRRPDRHVLVEAEPQQHRRAASSGRASRSRRSSASMSMVAEGVKSSPSVLDLAASARRRDADHRAGRRGVPPGSHSGRGARRR